MDTMILVFATLTQLCVAKPVAGFTLNYPPGRVFTYHYTTDTKLNEPDFPGVTQAKKDVGFRFTAVCEILSVWTDTDQHLMKMTVNTPKIHSVARDDVMRELKGLPRLPVYFQWTGGRVGEVFAFEDDSALAVNIKKGIISLFQLQLESGSGEELDASGMCNVKYLKDGNMMQKTKTSCTNSEVVGKFSNVNSLFSVSLKSTSHTTYEIRDDIIKGIVSEETFISRVNIQNDIATSVAVRQDMRLEGTAGTGSTVTAISLKDVVKSISSSEGYVLYSMTLVTVFGGKQQCTEKCPSTSDIVRDWKDHMTSSSLATKEASEAFLAVIDAFRTSTKESILGILSDEGNEEIVPQLIDAAAAAQTRSTQEALMEYIKFEDEMMEELSQRYLLSVALSSTHPDKQLLTDLLSLFEKNLPTDNLQEAIGEALGAVTHTYCQKGSQCQEKIVEDIQKVILARLDTCNEDNCKAQAIRALTNAGLHDSLPVLLRYAEEATNPVISEASIKALRKIKNTDLEQIEIKAVMKRIFHQLTRGYDTAVRSKALKILLESDPSEEELKEILAESMDPWNTDYDMYIQARIFNLMAQDMKIKKMVKPHLRDTNISNYNILAPKGKSLAFSNQMAETQGAQADYFIYVENGRSGIMKRSGMDVNLFGGKQTLSVFSIGIFAGGMEGLLGEEVEPGQEDVEPTAGLALDLVDVTLPPITFFTGQGGLMSAIWNAPSEPVSALQVNILLHDHHETLHLQNGLIVEVDVEGCVSLDLTGSLSVSLWNRNSQSLIKNNASLLIKGSSRIVTPSFRTGVEFSADSIGSIEFQSDVDFLDKIKMCLQMGRPELIYSHHVKKYEHAYGFNTGYISRISRSRKLPAVSYPLPKQNAEQCRAIGEDS